MPRFDWRTAWNPADYFAVLTEVEVLVHGAGGIFPLRVLQILSRLAQGIRPLRLAAAALLDVLVPGRGHVRIQLERTTVALERSLEIVEQSLAQAEPFRGRVGVALREPFETRLGLLELAFVVVDQAQAVMRVRIILFSLQDLEKQRLSPAQVG